VRGGGEGGERRGERTRGGELGGKRGERWEKEENERGGGRGEKGRRKGEGERKLEVNRRVG